MSQYANFYIHDKDKNTYQYLVSYGRCSNIYKFFDDYLTYGTGTKITVNIANSVLMYIEKTIDKYNSYILEAKNIQEAIVKMNDPIDKKIEAINQYNIDIDTYKQEIAQCQITRGFVITLKDFIENVDIWAGVEWCPEGED